MSNFNTDARNFNPGNAYFESVTNQLPVSRVEFLELKRDFENLKKSLGLNPDAKKNEDVINEEDNFLLKLSKVLKSINDTFPDKNSNQ